MSTFAQRFVLVAQLTWVVLVLFLSGCDRSATRVNSDPGTGRQSRAEGGEKAARPDANNAGPSARPTDANTGTDSTGRPSYASGGATAAGSGSGTSGTATTSPQSADKAGK